jgi:hypothetical protein
MCHTSILNLTGFTPIFLIARPFQGCFISVTAGEGSIGVGTEEKGGAAVSIGEATASGMTKQMG